MYYLLTISLLIEMKLAVLCLQLSPNVPSSIHPRWRKGSVGHGETLLNRGLFPSHCYQASHADHMPRHPKARIVWWKNKGFVFLPSQTEFRLSLASYVSFANSLTSLNLYYLFIKTGMATFFPKVTQM